MKSREGQRLRLQLLALELFADTAPFDGVFCCRRAVGRVPTCAAAGVSPVCGSCGHSSVSTCGHADADLRALDGVVVQEDETVQAEIESGCERTQVFRLRLPVDCRRDDMVTLQAEVGARVEDAPDVGFFVLAAEGDQDAAR